MIEKGAVTKHLGNTFKELVALQYAKREEVNQELIKMYQLR